MVIPALKAPQNNINEDILLCPVRALSIYLKLTLKLRQDKILLFVSYKQGHSKDIQCSTISSWIKNTIKFCYSRVGDSDMDWLGVKAHDVRAFAASKAFYGPNSPSLPLEISQFIYILLSQGPIWPEPERLILPLRILRGCSTSGGSSLAVPPSKMGGGYRTTHPADGSVGTLTA